MELQELINEVRELIHEASSCCCADNPDQAREYLSDIFKLIIDETDTEVKI